MVAFYHYPKLDLILGEGVESDGDNRKTMVLTTKTNTTEISGYGSNIMLLLSSLGRNNTGGEG